MQDNSALYYHSRWHGSRYFSKVFAFLPQTPGFMIQKILSRYLIFILLASALFDIMNAQEEDWVSVDFPVGHNLNSMSFLNDSTGWVAGDSGTIAKTVDGANTWSLQIMPNREDILDVFFADSDHGWAIAHDLPEIGQQEYGTFLFRTSDGGASWDSLYICDEFLNTIYFSGTLEGWVGGDFGTILITENGGDSWANVQFDSSGFIEHPVRRIRFRTADVGFGTGGRYDLVGAIWRTLDGGNTWSAVPVGPEPLDDIHFFDDDHLIALGGDFEYGVSFVESFDGGEHWIYNTLNIFGEATSIDFRTQDDAWVTLGFAGKYMLSNDGAATWTEFPTPGNVPMYEVQFLDSLTGFMIGDEGTVLKYVPDDVVSIGEPARPIVSGNILHPNYPNPFNPGTVIRYSLTVTSHVQLTIYNVAGELVRTLVEGQLQAANSYEVAWDGTNTAGAPVASGTYFAKMVSESSNGSRKQVSKVQKMTLLR